MKTVFYTIVDDRYYYPAGAHILVNTFRRFHPDIPLVVFRQNAIDQVFAQYKINFYMAKPYFARLLTKDYDRVINIDCDTVITGRLEAILDTDWEVGGVTNLNDYENATFGDIKPEMYVQAGLVGSTNAKFWDIWAKANEKAMSYIRQENDVLNMIWYNDPEVSKMKRLIWDEKRDYYGCKALGREGEMYLEGGELMLRKEKVKAYHHAKGANFPKLYFPNMGFRPEVTKWLTDLSTYGQTEIHNGLL